jgi:hypothetical protein
MTSIVPNRTKIEGKVVSVEKSDHHDDFSVLKIKTRQVGPVEGKANLADKSGGVEMLIHISKEVLDKHKLKVGSQLSATIRKTPKDLFVIPDSIVVIKTHN